MSRERDDRRKRAPSPLGEVIAEYLRSSGLDARVQQAGVVPEWGRLVGAQIAGATEPLFVTPDGTLFVAVLNSSWMTELSLMEPELLRALNVAAGRPRIARIRFRLLEPGARS